MSISAELRDCGFQQNPQIVLASLLGRRPPWQINPACEIPDSHPVLDLRLFYDNGDRRTLPDLVHPIVRLENAKPSGHSLIKCSGRNLNGVLHALAVSTRHPASPDRHLEIIDSSLLFRQEPIAPTGLNTSKAE
jgi:hypothetical protein